MITMEFARARGTVPEGFPFILEISSDYAVEQGKVRLEDKVIFSSSIARTLDQQESIFSSSFNVGVVLTCKHPAITVAFEDVEVLQIMFLWRWDGSGDRCSKIKKNGVVVMGRENKLP